MLRLTTLLLLISSFIWSASATNNTAPTLPNTLTVYLTYHESSEHFRPNKGRRDLPAPVECVIDLQERTLTSASPLINSIVRFQILTADGETTLYDGSDPSDMIKFITTLPQGTYMMCLVGEDYCLYGNFKL